MKPFNKKIRNLTLVLILLMPIYPNSELLGEQNIVKIEVNENIKNKEEAKEEIKRLVELVIDLEEKNLFKETIPYLNEILILEKKFLGKKHIDVGGTLEWIGLNLSELGMYKKAEEYLSDSIQITKKHYGQKSSEYSYTLNLIGITFHERNLLNEAEKKYLKALEIQKSLNDSDEIQTTLYNLGRVYQDKSDFQKSEDFFKKSLDLIQKNQGIKNEDYVDSLDSLADLYYKKGSLSKSAKIYEQALKIGAQLYGENNANYLLIATGLGQVYSEQGLYKKAEQLFYKIIKKQKLINDDNIATTFNNLGLLYVDQGLYEKAEEYLFEALKIDEKIYGYGHKYIAPTLNNISLNFRDKGELKKAKKFALRAIKIYEKEYGKNHPDYANSLSNLALIYQDDGLYSEAEELLLKSLKVRENVLGRSHPATGVTLNNLGLNYLLKGINKKAEPLLLRNLKIIKKSFGENHPKTAIALNNLSLIYEDPKQTIPLLKRSLKISKKIFGENHPSTSVAMANLALAYDANGEYEKAENLLLSSIEIDKNTFGGGNINFATSLSNLADIYSRKKEYKKAEHLLLEALSINEKFLNTNHPDISSNYIDLGSLYQKKELLKNAISFYQKGIEMDHYLITREVPFIVIGDRMEYISSFKYGYDQVMSLSFEENEGTKLALNTRLNRQGLLEEIEKRQSQLYNLSKEEKIIAYKINSITQKLSNSNLSFKDKNALTIEKENLERKLYRLLPKLEPKIINIVDVAKKLPGNSILIEYQKYIPHEVNQEESLEDNERYLAFIIWPNGEYKVVDLGNAAVIEKIIKRALIASEYAYSDAQDIWNQLGIIVLDPILNNAKNTKNLFISPDSELNRVPFAVLKNVDKNNYLNEDYNIRLLTTGRELIELKKNSNISSRKSLIVANPKFTLQKDEKINLNFKLKNQLRSVGLEDQIWERLPGTQKEGIQISNLTKGELLVDEKASALNIQNRKASKILHIASHAYYLNNNDLEINSLLKSGIVLAGANHPELNPQDDGYLTALEISRLNWIGTELVVISACESGLGDIESGEGVYGIKRSISVAGARSSLLSLWKVQDSATAAFMESFYKKLINKEGRADALASTQKEFRNHPIEAWRHPNVWAAFQLSGDWRPIDF